jgi:hypothetical protein
MNTRVHTFQTQGNDVQAGAKFDFLMLAQNKPFNRKVFIIIPYNIIIDKKGVFMSNINIELKGYTADIIGKMLDNGYAKTKTEAIRLALFEFDQIHKLTEEELYAKAAQKILKDIKSGKEKTLKYRIKAMA